MFRIGWSFLAFAPNAPTDFRPAHFAPLQIHSAIPIIAEKPVRPAWRQNMKRLILFLVLAIPTAFAQNKKAAKDSPAADSKSTTQEFMQSKKAHMADLFDGVLNKDFGKAAEKAKVLMMLSRASTWHQIDSEEYQRHSNLFQEALRFFIEKAEAKNVEGVSIGYVRLSMSCMHCHHEVRWKK
jgi:hypothetical protein